MRKNVCLDKNIIIELYEKQKLTLAKVSEKMNCCIPTLRKNMKEYGIHIRGLSEALMGREILWKEKIGISNKGRITSPETREKMSKTRKEKYIIPITKGLRKASSPGIVKSGVVGEKHWNWKGGISKEENVFRQSSEYKLWRDRVFQNDDYCCWFCGEHTRTLQAHHLILFSTLFKLRNIDNTLYNELIFDPNNGVTLCAKCHSEFHKEARDAQRSKS